MKVLFAVNNDNISDSVVKKYQKEFREIISYKNVYYFNAILKELQKDKTYDRVIVSEDLEPFANNNYDTIDKFLFDKLDNISDEATNETGENTDIILICTDRRNKSDNMLVKLFGIGIYNAIIGKDRSVDEVCKLINKPRTKKDAKIYYKIESDNVGYQSESENNVSEAEVQNILAHYKRLGKNEDKYVDSFNNIVNQYTDVQLKIIIQYLPINVKAVLEEMSPKYQELVTFSKEQGSSNIGMQDKARQYKQQQQQEETDKFKIELLERHSNKVNISRPIVIPTGINDSGVRKLIKETPNRPEEIEEVKEVTKEELLEQLDSLEDEEVNNNNNEIYDEVENINPNINANIASNANVTPNVNINANPTPNVNINADTNANVLEEVEEIEEAPETNAPQEVEVQAEPEKKGRGRPKKILSPEELEQIANKVKRGRGRPKKVEDVQDEVEERVEEKEQEDVNLFGLGDEEEDTKADERHELDEVEVASVPQENEEEDMEEENSESVNLFGLDDEEDEEEAEVQGVQEIRR